MLGINVRILASLGLLVLVTGLGGGSVDAASTLSVSITAIFTDSIAISWTQTSDACFNHYEIQSRKQGNSSWYSEGTLSTASSTSALITGLQPDTAYEFRVIDFDCVGSQPSGTNSATTHNLVNLTLDSTTLESATISWTMSNMISICFGNYTVETRPSGTAPWLLAAVVASQTTTSFTVSGLAAGSTHDIRVVDHDCFTTTISNTVNAQIIAHNMATTQVVSVAGLAAVIQWQGPNVEASCFQKYTIQYRAQSSATWQTYSSISSFVDHNETVGNLQGGITYEFRVVTTDCLGIFNSTVATAKIWAAPAVQLQQATRDNIRVEWTMSEDPCFQRYELQYRRLGVTAWSTADTITDKATASGAIQHLEAGSSYEVRVVEVGCGDSRASEPLAIQTAAVPSFENIGGVAGLGGIIGAAIVLAIVGFVMLKRRGSRAALQKKSEPARPAHAEPDTAGRFCSQCGAKVVGPFCVSCGAKVS